MADTVYDSQEVVEVGYTLDVQTVYDAQEVVEVGYVTPATRFYGLGIGNG